MSYFTKTRNIELSTLYYLETEIATSWTGITIVKAFTNAYKSSLPVVCIRLYDVNNDRKEIGATTLRQFYDIYIDLFCSSDGQRIDLAHFIVDKLKDGWVYFTHEQTSGDPETLTRTADGRITVTRFNNDNKVDFGEEGVDAHDRFRHFLSITVRKD
jgi:hypothetical protein